MKNEENRAFYLHVMTDQKTSMEKTLSIKKEYKNKKKILQHQQCCCCKKAQKIKIPHLAKLPACLPMSTRLHKTGCSLFIPCRYFKFSKKPMHSLHLLSTTVVSSLLHIIIKASGEQMEVNLCYSMQIKVSAAK